MKKKIKTSLFKAVKETKRQCGTNHEHNGMTINPQTPQDKFQDNMGQPQDCYLWILKESAIKPNLPNTD